MNNTLNERKPSAAQNLRTAFVTFMVVYGLHYFGYFLRARYFTWTETLGLGADIVHVLMYCGHTVFLILLLLFALIVKEDGKYILTFTKGRPSRNLLWLGLGALTGLLLMGLCILSASLHGDITIAKAPPQNALLFVLALLAVLLQASTEEIESRAFLFGRMKGLGVPVAVAIPVSAFFFSYLHAANPGFGWVPLLSIFVVGVQYALAYHYFGNIWFCFGAHTLWNFTQDFVFGLPDSGKPAAVSMMNTTVNGSSFFYDAQFGIEGSFMAICLNALACVVIFLIGRKLIAGRKEN